MPIKKPKKTYEEARAEARRQHGAGPDLYETAQQPDSKEATPESTTDPKVAPGPETTAEPETPPTEADPTTDPKSIPASEAAPSAQPAKPKQNTPAERKPKPPSKARAEPSAPAIPRKSVNIPVHAKTPEPGFSPAFDDLAAHYGAELTLRRLLQRAIAAMLKSMTGTGKLPDISYPTGHIEVRTTTTMTSDQFTQIKNLLDPSDMLSTRAVAHQFAVRALAAHLNELD